MEWRSRGVKLRDRAHFLYRASICVDSTKGRFPSFGGKNHTFKDLI